MNLLQIYRDYSFKFREYTILSGIQLQFEERKKSRNPSNPMTMDDNILVEKMLEKILQMD